MRHMHAPFLKQQHIACEAAAQHTSLRTCMVVAQHRRPQASSRLAEHHLADVVVAAGTSRSDDRCNVAARWAGVSGVHAQYVQHVPAVHSSRMLVAPIPLPKACRQQLQQCTHAGSSCSSAQPATALRACRAASAHLKLRPTARTASATCPAEGASRPSTGIGARLEREPRGCGLRCTGSNGARLRQGGGSRATRLAGWAAQPTRESTALQDVVTYVHVDTQQRQGVTHMGCRSSLGWDRAPAQDAVPCWSAVQAEGQPPLSRCCGSEALRAHWRLGFSTAATLRAAASTALAVQVRAAAGEGEASKAVMACTGAAPPAARMR